MSPKRSPFQWVADGAEGFAYEPQPRPDRGAARKESEALNELAIGLGRLPPERRAALRLEPEVRAELETLARLVEGGAWRRQVRRLATLLRDEDVGELQAVLDGKGPRDAYVQAAKDWTRRLLKEGDPAVELLLEEGAELDRQQIRTLIRNARAEGEAGTKARARLVKRLSEARLGPPPPGEEAPQEAEVEEG